MRDGVTSTIKLAVDKNLNLKTLDKQVRIVLEKQLHNRKHLDDKVEFEEIEKKKGLK